MVIDNAENLSPWPERMLIYQGHTNIPSHEPSPDPDLNYPTPPFRH